MAVLTTFTSATDVEEVVPTEELSSFVLGYEYARPVGLACAWAQPGTGSIAVRFPRFGSISVPAGTKTESDVYTDVEIATAENTITPGLVGFRMPLSSEMTVQSLGGIPAQVLAQAIDALADRMDSDILSSSTSATNTAGAVTDDYTLSRFRSDLSTYRGLNIPTSPMGHCLNLHENGAVDLLDSMGSTAAVFAKEDGDTLRIGPNAGYLGNLYGVAVYSSSNTPTDSTGHSGLLTPIGFRNSGFGIVMSRAPRVIRSFGDDAAVRDVEYYVFSAWYGTGLTAEERCLECLHQ